ncbi:hypothetical protein BU26DRAFT_22884 [Trematosphaeria pertusa]|uniref:Uncharacterized protein n=1 Tax=Trematosphaeria pertusa TaxID=390896 RepID=A0A6A6J4Q2_9PLEO|nr:uncharacterized protein BU26DRAFT_22884 [Trematosphaeria pertusa]KAF2256463.1 hypothetical protein BU26DRAFT_22884 [Trematosphaeria pertusa]
MAATIVSPSRLSEEQSELEMEGLESTKNWKAASDRRAKLDGWNAATRPWNARDAILSSRRSGSEGSYHYTTRRKRSVARIFSEDWILRLSKAFGWQFNIDPTFFSKHSRTALWERRHEGGNTSGRAPVNDLKYSFFMEHYKLLSRPVQSRTRCETRAKCGLSTSPGSPMILRI